MRLAWLTDIHFNFLDDTQITTFLKSLRERPLDAVVITGDIGEAHSLPGYLMQIEAELLMPIYFVLGNHDYYFGSITDIREKVQRLCESSKWLHWLPDEDVISLADDVALVGHDGWGDGRCGDYTASNVEMLDYRVISDFIGLSKGERLRKLNQLGDEAAAYLRDVLPQALATHAHVIVATHVPPFKRACWHQGRISDDHFLPHFTCKIVGDVLSEMMAAHPQQRMTVLCGHTHGSGEISILDNLHVITGGAEYGAPQIQHILQFG